MRGEKGDVGKYEAMREMQMKEQINWHDRCCVDSVGGVDWCRQQNVRKEKKKMEKPWIPAKVDGVTQCGRAQHCTRNRHTHDQNTAVIPEPVINPSWSLGCMARLGVKPRHLSRDLDALLQKAEHRVDTPPQGS